MSPIPMKLHLTVLVKTLRETLFTSTFYAEGLKNPNVKALKSEYVLNLASTNKYVRYKQN